MRKIFATALGVLLLVCCTPKQTEQAGWHSVEPEDFTTQPVDLLANRWMALSVGNQYNANSMTIAWGSFGFLWNKPIVIVYVSEDRFTKHLMDGNEYFTVTAFPQSLKCKTALGYLGSASGRDEDKMAGCGLTVKYTELIQRGQRIFVTRGQMQTLQGVTRARFSTMLRTQFSFLSYSFYLATKVKKISYLAKQRFLFSQTSLLSIRKNN